MLNVVIANILDIIDNTIYTISASKETKKEIMKMQSFGCIFGILAEALLGGYTGVLLGITALFRNVLTYKNMLTLYTVIAIVFIQTIGAIYINEGILGLLAAMATITYTIMLYRSSSKKAMCLAIMLNTSMWALYNLSILAFTATIFNIIGFITAIINYRNQSKQDSIRKPQS